MSSGYRLLRYHKNFGVRGVIATISHLLCGWPKEFIAYPLGSRTPVRIRPGTTDAATYVQVIVRGEYSFDLPFSPEIIIDAGANIGMASIYFANRYPKARIIAIEAEARNYALLAKNVAPYPMITPIHAALWNRDGEISVSEPDPQDGMYGEWGFITREGQGPKVRAITVPTLMREMQLHAVDVFKVDIEGAELEVFQTGSWIDYMRCLMVELHDQFRPGCSEAVNALAENFSMVKRGETTLYLRQIQPASRASSAS